MDGFTARTPKVAKRFSCIYSRMAFRGNKILNKNFKRWLSFIPVPCPIYEHK